MNNYLDLIMTNNVFEENTTEELLSDNNQKGGQNSHDNPTGGFPPIIIIDKEKAEQKEANKNRELGSVSSGISIKDILGKKRS